MYSLSLSPFSGVGAALLLLYRGLHPYKHGLTNLPSLRGLLLFLIILLQRVVDGEFPAAVAEEVKVHQTV
jgi:hypothetical protein